MLCLCSDRCCFRCRAFLVVWLCLTRTAVQTGSQQGMTMYGYSSRLLSSASGPSSGVRFGSWRRFGGSLPPALVAAALAVLAPPAPADLGTGSGAAGSRMDPAGASLIAAMEAVTSPDRLRAEEIQSSGTKDRPLAVVGRCSISSGSNGRHASAFYCLCARAFHSQNSHARRALNLFRVDLPVDLGSSKI